MVRSREPRVYVHPLTSLTRNSDNARSLLQLSVVSKLHERTLQKVPECPADGILVVQRAAFRSERSDEHAHRVVLTKQTVDARDSMMGAATTAGLGFEQGLAYGNKQCGRNAFARSIPNQDAKLVGSGHEIVVKITTDFFSRVNPGGNGHLLAEWKSFGDRGPRRYWRDAQSVKLNPRIIQYNRCLKYSGLGFDHRRRQFDPSFQT